jgi:hypothetical protein
LEVEGVEGVRVLELETVEVCDGDIAVDEIGVLLIQL